ncbi:sigma-70 family RNA polymerase sigma factor [Planctomicrobium piriforme]|uniref:RNA polymerase sigma-70 factor, ECF subfamily n=1 Tax=Planctomicrobium piriforme TaxID=1576369 RepID=A0A1I3JC76_9PLAN|nr:sigma-70 family RNA polymerase sigma factor [Planctomicrobium piriforme]SFI57871.1 RNA polymerase sigma-70 factor, ECF subfamily [Planctomicrobium piriforme]
MSEGASSRIGRLLEQARDGDVAARDQLFQSCRNYVAVIARAQVESWMRAKVDASDLVQQTMLEAHRGFDEFKGCNEAEWLAWLKQILGHNTQDFIRRYRTAKRQAGLEVPAVGTESTFDPIGEFAAASMTTPSQVLMAHERELAVADAIAQLSEDHQTVLQLRSLQRLPFDEVAQRMNRSRPAVQMLWMRAVQKLEETLHEADQS